MKNLHQLREKAGRMEMRRAKFEYVNAQMKVGDENSHDLLAAS